MSLYDQIKEDMYRAMKTGDKLRTATLRNVFSALKNRRIETRRDVSDAEAQSVLRSQVKQRQDSITQYQRGNRPDLVEKETAELKIIQEYLPQMMNAEELRSLVAEVISETGASSPADMGRVMPRVMAAGKGRIDGKLASQWVRELLTKT
ncbi:MAG: GatB/YqeY domain-containing protein [FCB group bacterium]|nr:GatB/YqeY domain-containing protein [FCB group bacterium]